MAPQEEADWDKAHSGYWADKTYQGNQANLAASSGEVHCANRVGLLLAGLTLGERGTGDRVSA
jgi:hypothetical protein